jgi:hypothetical protein
MNLEGTMELQLMKAILWKRLTISWSSNWNVHWIYSTNCQSCHGNLAALLGTTAGQSMADRELEILILIVKL